MSEARVSYNNRTFSEIQGDLISLVEQYYPEILADFTDSSVGSMFIDLNAGVSNMLSVNIDRAFQETQLRHAQKDESISDIGINMGFKTPGKRPSVTVVDFTVNVPPKGDSPDESYLPAILPGAQIVGGGKIFETQDVIDFSSPVSSLGDQNRSLKPILNNNGVIQSYEVTKREVVINGSTNIFKKVVRTEDVVSFYELILPDPDVIEVDSIILLQGTNFSGNPTDADFNNPDNRYYEVEYLAQQRVFTNDPNSGSNPQTSGSTGIKVGSWLDVTKKFIKEYSTNGFCTLTFGGGDNETDNFKNSFNSVGVFNRQFLNNYLNNTALGLKLKKDHTLFIKYRVGGGSSSNVGANTLTTVGGIQMNVNGPRQDINTRVNRSLRVNNPIPAIGGNDGLSIEQKRNLISYNFSSQQRSTNITDYLVQTYLMPGKYGSPYRLNAFRENNKVVIPILGKDSSGKLNNTSNNLLKENITEYLSGFRMVNDYVEVRNGRIFNLGFDVDLYVDDTNDNQLANSVISTIRNYLNIDDNDMNTDLFIGQLENQITALDGVNNVLSIKVYNKVGDGYSVNPVEQEIVDENTGEIKLINNTIYSTEDSMFEVKYPEKDIKVFLRKKTNLGV